MEKYNFIGKNLKSEDKNIASRFLDKRHSQEVEKEQSDYRYPTQEEIFNIEKSKELVMEELKSLGINTDTLCINDYDFKFLKESGGKGAYDSETHIIEIENKYSVNLENILKNPAEAIPMMAYFIQKLLSKILDLNKDSKTESNYRTMIHESIHSNSFHEYNLNINNKNNLESRDVDVNSYRNGYLLTKNNQRDYFRGLNEGIVDRTTMDILIKEYKNKPNIANQIRRILYYMESRYFIEMITINAIISKIAKNQNEKKDEVWARFKAGQFTGNMMHLRDIEKVYGAGSLRVLATMNPRVNMKNIKNFLYYTYFSTKSGFVRKIIEDKLLLKESNDRV